jgi:uncharacterized protein (TIGR02444 family)
MSEDETKLHPRGSPFWRFSIGLYRQPEVADACICLQEQAGVDVNLLLFLLWQATLHRLLSADEVASLEAQIRPWREATVVPLRAVRRALKSPPPLVAADTAESFRTRIKVVELEAERLQEEAMYKLAQAGCYGQEVSSAEEAARANVAALASTLGAKFADGAVATLLAALQRPRAQPED